MVRQADFSALWRFVFESEDRSAAQEAAEKVADLLGLSDLLPVAPYEEPTWRMTDTVASAREDAMPVLFGRQLALAGRLASEWSVHGLAGLDDGERCHAVYDIGERNPPSVPGLGWALMELWAKG